MDQILPRLNDTSHAAVQAASKLLQNYRFTPATLANKIANRHVSPGMPLRWYPKPFLMYISLKIAQGIARGNARIIISAPPRHGKSRISTIWTPVWVLELFAAYNVVITTYGADLSEDFSREIRDIIKDNPNLLNVRIKEDASRVAKFLTTSGGGVTAVGLGGPITGRGANVLLIDDYIKQIKEALSPTYRTQMFEWFTTTAMTRLEPNASVIIVATRWHSDDLIGRVVKAFPGEWEYIEIPAIAYENEPDILGREPGEALFPERYPIKSLEQRKRLLGTKYFDAIFQQRPHEDDEKLTDRAWMQTVTKLPNINQLKFLRVWDMAATQGGGDYTCGVLLAFDPVTKYIYLCDVIRRQYSPGRVEALIRSTAVKDSTATEIALEQEPSSAGKATAEHYKNQVLEGFKVQLYPVTKKKEVRAYPFIAAVESQRFYMLEAEWNRDFLDEFEQFPNGEHDDQVDPCAIGYDILLGKSGKSVTWGRGRKNPAYQTTATIIDRLQKQQDEIRKTKGLLDEVPSIAKKASITMTSKGATFGRGR